MGDHRASIQITMEAHGKEYKTDMWINWSPDDDGCDRRVTEWFRDCWADAYARYDDEVWEAQRESRERKQREDDLAKLAELKAKYEAKP